MRRRSHLRRSALLVLLVPVAFACGADSAPKNGVEACLETQARGDCLPAHPGGKADAPDPCAKYGWYDDPDGYCDGSYCAMPDPDCGPDPDACGDTPESEGMVWKGDASVGCEPDGSASEEIEVLLTAPYCDTCSAADKAILTPRSPITKRVVELLDGAKQTVDLAQFTFSVAEIADAVERAHARGVVVRLAMDAAQDRQGSRANDLKQKGVDVRFVAGKPAGSQAGLQHAKFMLVDGTTLLTGSANFSSTGTTINEENAIVVRAAAAHPLLTGFSCHFTAIWDRNFDAAGACSNQDVAFAPSSVPRNMIRDRIRAATDSVDVIMHHFTFADLVKELTTAAQRGVRVRVLLNATTRTEHQGVTWSALVAAGGEIRYKQVDESTFQLLHHKLAVIDGKTLISGSGNWSGNAFFNNFENYVVYGQPRVVQTFRALYHRLWTWSLSAQSLDGAVDAATQHAQTTQTFFGNFHSHFVATEAGRLIDDGKPQRLDENGAVVAVAIPSSVKDSARHAFEYARDVGGLDFMALSPHCHEEGAVTSEGNMTESGFVPVVEASRELSSSSFLALAGMEWSTNSTGNHAGVIGTEAVAKTARGRFDLFYGAYLTQREAAGDRPLVMLNHPRTFRAGDESMNGSWDMVFGVNLLEVPKVGERNQKFNDFGLDDFEPLSKVRPSWIAGEAMPDAGIVDQTWINVLKAAGPYVRMMEVTLNRGTEFGGEIPQNPSLVPIVDQPGAFERRTKVHTDYDYFLTRGFYIAPVASHDNHYANWGAGHTSRTAVIAARLTRSQLLDAVEQREVFASEDQNLVLRFYAENRVPMGARHVTPKSQLPARFFLQDPDYSGAYQVALYRGKVGQDGVSVAVELGNLPSGWHDLTLDLSTSGEHFFYLEVLEVGANRMAWTAPIWIERI
jgi:phosphatidylserine/phosphatidylglycerophosphate/cardiolipin synthase-like enzyme